MKYRERVRKVLCLIAAVCDFVTEIIKYAVSMIIVKIHFTGNPTENAFWCLQCLGAHLLLKTMSKVWEPCFLHICPMG